MPPEDSWIIPLEFLEREIPHSYVDPSKPGRRRTKKRRGVRESFPQKRISVQYLCSSIATNFAYVASDALSIALFVAINNSFVKNN
ncbi:hypothetical protein H5410_052103 [Solanum commersonii]|uniref:Uncharacterized protein n=1 Tax=Solanum commersonii TaxID=4109 RepID=A0A9J5X2E9_SOLCO|nr:hypothetical protein H5410_052103 [Solanum commersonii]